MRLATVSADPGARAAVVACHAAGPGPCVGPIAGSDALVVAVPVTVTVAGAVPVADAGAVQVADAVADAVPGAVAGRDMANPYEVVAPVAVERCCFKGTPC